MDNLLLPENSTILLDTNFLIDLFEHESKYAQFFQAANNKNIALVASILVKGEFIRSKDKVKFQDKNTLFSKTVDSILPIDVQIHELLAPTIEEYSQDIEGVSIVDLTLACFLKRYSGLYLLTRNHKDFPTRIFHRSYVFSIEHERDVKTYALYQYMPRAKQVEVEEIPF